MSETNTLIIDSLLQPQMGTYLLVDQSRLAQSGDLKKYVSYLFSKWFHQLDCILQKGTKSIAMLLRLCNFTHCDITIHMLKKHEIYMIIFVLNIQFLVSKIETV